MVSLGMARLLIFEHFCLPSMIAQSSQQFIWIIRTDPQLHPTIRDRLLTLLRDHPNFLVVPSNNNPEGFRQHSKTEKLELWTGSLELYHSFAEAAQTRIVLESRLDADDGLHIDFVQFMRLDVAKYVVQPDDWMVYCAFSHLEWHYSSPFKTTADPNPAGYLVGLRHKDCVTPGLSFVYGINATRDLLPEGNHQQLHRVLPSCHHQTKCLRRFEKLVPGAIRARTPTSAGMSNVMILKWGKKSFYKRAASQGQKQHQMWQGTHNVFALNKSEIEATKSYIGDHLREIAADNLSGQCTKGHSCKSESKALLKELAKV